MKLSSPLAPGRISAALALAVMVAAGGAVAQTAPVEAQQGTAAPVAPPETPVVTVEPQPEAPAGAADPAPVPEANAQPEPVAAPAPADVAPEGTPAVAPPAAQGVEPAAEDPASVAEPATEPQVTDGDGTAPDASSSTGWTGGTGGSLIGTNPQGAVGESVTWQPPTARGLDLQGVPDPVN
ncbi:MAG: hypothetical protein Q4G22_10775 [Paracoccus sp. (in: a-proteobacteria)]|uniref:hypothetical protein n=1 Tax=Paracoccus sp. TaxID=267 RepID=UPI0026E0CEBA|nr:hypothetical protein [Paracoccus sp. (in: a-proteobacteria)]MDO5632309.1 hypothetical protein [Paracoccus sp. (in: a-proteobacteria)]